VRISCQNISNFNIPQNIKLVVAAHGVWFGLQYTKCTPLNSKHCYKHLGDNRILIIGNASQYDEYKIHHGKKCPAD